MSKISEHINLLRTCSVALVTLSAAWLLALATILWTPVMIVADLVAWSLTDKNRELCT